MCMAGRSRSKAKWTRARGSTSICPSRFPASGPAWRGWQRWQSFLPNRHCLLQLVYDELRGGERLAAMGRFDPYQQRRLAHGDHADSVDDPNPFQRPALVRLGEELVELMLDHFAISGVVQRVNWLAVLRPAHDSPKRHDAAHFAIEPAQFRFGRIDRLIGEQ